MSNSTTTTKRDALDILDDDSIEIVPLSVRWNAASEIAHSRRTIKELREELAEETLALKVAKAQIARLRGIIAEQEQA